MLVTDEDEIGQGVADPVRAIALTKRRILAEDATDRLQVCPARHCVVADEQETAGGEMPPCHGQDLLAHLRCHPAPHAMQGDEVERPQVGRQCPEPAGDHTGIGQAGAGDVAGDRGRVLGIDVHSHEFAVRVGGGERRQATAEPAAEFEVAEAGGDPRWGHSVERRHVPQRCRGEMAVEARDVGDVGDVAFGSHGRSPWESEDYALRVSLR